MNYANNRHEPTTKTFRIVSNEMTTNFYLQKKMSILFLQNLSIHFRCDSFTKHAMSHPASDIIVRQNSVNEEKKEEFLPFALNVHVEHLSCFEACVQYEQWQVCIII